MMRQRLLTIASISFAVLVIVLGIWEIVSPSRIVNGLVPISACVMLLAGGLTRYLDREKTVSYRLGRAYWWRRCSLSVENGDPRP